MAFPEGPSGQNHEIITREEQLRRWEEEREAARRGVLHARVGWIVGLAAIIVAIGLALPSYLRSTDPPKNAQPRDPSATGRLEVASVVVRNPPALERLVSIRGREYRRQTEGSKPTIDVTVINRSGERQLITGATLMIASYSEIQRCITLGEGDVPISNTYDVTLPTTPLTDERRLDVSLHQQVGPDQSDRVRLRLGVEEEANVNTHLYAVELRFRVHRSPALRIGRVLIAAPGAVPRDGLGLPEQPEYLRDPYRTPQSTWCMDRNVSEVRRMLRDPGLRAAPVAMLRDMVVSPAWTTERRRAMREAGTLSELLRYPNSYEVPLHYATTVLKSPADEARVRREAQQGTLDRARAALKYCDERPLWALREAKAAVHFGDTSIAQEAPAAGSPLCLP